MNLLPVNRQEAYRDWQPIIESEAGITNPDKLSWLSEYCHTHALYENFSPSTYSTLGIIPGMGSVRYPSNPGGAATFYNGAQGSGDKIPTLLPLAIQVAARTIAFDLVSVVPLQGPTGMLAYLDYEYAGGTLTSSQKPHVIKIKLSGTPIFAVGTLYFGTNVGGVGPLTYALNNTAIELTYVGRSRIDGQHIFKTGNTIQRGASAWASNPDLTVIDVFDGTANIVTAQAGGVGEPSQVASTTTVTSAQITTNAELVRALEDHIQGFAGAGPTDTNPWTGPFTDGVTEYDGMNRLVGETTYPRMMGLKLRSKSVAAQTIQVGVTVTTEMIQDLNKQWGVDVYGMLDNQLANELSQHINKHLLSRLFALGWTNHVRAADAEGINLNIAVDPSLAAGNTPAYLTTDTTTVAMTRRAFANVGGFENLTTIQRRIQGAVLAAGNVITQRGRRGPGNFAVVNAQVATALQDSAQYQFAPLQNTVNQNNGNLYPVGDIAGVKLHVDPLMRWSDTRMLIGRKGAEDEHGLKFMPYLMAESISTISEGTMSPKHVVKSRYAVVEAGQLPETQYLTVYVDPGAVSLLG